MVRVSDHRASADHPPMHRGLTESAIGEHDLAFRGTGCQKFDRLSRLNQREGGLNQGIDLLCRTTVRPAGLGRAEPLS